MRKLLRKTAHKICSLLNFAFIMSAFIIAIARTAVESRRSTATNPASQKLSSNYQMDVLSSVSAIDAGVGPPRTSFLFCQDAAEALT